MIAGRPSLGPSDIWSFSGPNAPLPPPFTPFFLLFPSTPLYSVSSILIYIIFIYIFHYHPEYTTSFLLGCYSRYFPHMLPINSFLQNFLDFPSHTLHIHMTTSHSPHTSTLKMETAQSSKTLVSNHHAKWCKTPENNL